MFKVQMKIGTMSNVLMKILIFKIFYLNEFIFKAGMDDR